MHLLVCYLNYKMQGATIKILITNLDILELGLDRNGAISNCGIVSCCGHGDISFEVCCYLQQ